MVASVPPLAMILRELLPESVQVESIVPAGSSPHAFDLTPSKAAILEQAALVARIGPGFDDFAATEERTWVYLQTVGAAEGANGHFWTDPQAVLETLPSLRAALSDAFPALSGEIEARSERLGRAIRAKLPQWTNSLRAVRGRSLVLFHDSLTPFCDRFGIRVAGMVEPKPGVEPSAAELIRLAREARTLRPRAVVSEPQLPARPARILAEELGVPVIVVDPYGDGTGGGYVSFVDGLVTKLSEALQ